MHGALALAVCLCASGCGRILFDVAANDAGSGGFTVDASFGNGGVVVIDHGSIDNLGFSVQGIAVQPDGRIIVAGKGGTSTNQDTLVVRLLDDGSLDPSFGAGGIVLVDVLAGEAAVSVALQPDGRIVVSGGRGGVSGMPTALLIRLEPDGSLDASFGNTSPGVTLVDFPGDPDSPNGAYLGPDGTIVFGGQTYTTTAGWDFATARVTRDGALDPSFGTGGTVKTDLLGSDEFGSPRAVLSDGRIYVAGSSYNGASSFEAVLFRLASTGALDTTFGAGGFTAIDFNGQTDRAQAAALDDQGRIIVVGHTREEMSPDGYARRILSNGSFDPTFAAGAGFLIDLGAEEILECVLPLPDQRVVLGGWSNHSGQYDFVIVVLHEDGTRDVSVGVDGLLEIDVVPGQDDKAWGFARDPEGRILAFGSTSAGAQNDLAIVRLVP